MTEQKTKVYRVACVDGSCMGHTSTKPELVAALEELLAVFPPPEMRLPKMSYAVAYAETVLERV